MLGWVAHIYSVYVYVCVTVYSTAGKFSCTYYVHMCCTSVGQACLDAFVLLNVAQFLCVTMYSASQCGRNAWLTNCAVVFGSLKLYDEVMTPSFLASLTLFRQIVHT